MTGAPVKKNDLILPGELDEWIGDAPLYESSGESGARTVFIDRGNGYYLKIAPGDTLTAARRMYSYFHGKGLSAKVVQYISADRDYLLMERVIGEDGTTPKFLENPERLCDVFAHSLRLLHEQDYADCPARDRMRDLVAYSKRAVFEQRRLDSLSRYTGNLRAEDAARMIAENEHVIKHDALILGDYCLPNIMLDQFRFTGFIDVADAGVGDRHYDLIWGIWTLGYNLKSDRCGQRFLDAYGKEGFDQERLRICALLSAMD